MATTAQLLTALSAHQGAENGLHVDALARLLDCPEREIRRLATALREEGVAVCAHPSHGYFIARTPEELERTCRFLRSRAMKSLELESRLRKVPLPDLLEQMRLPT